MNGKLKYIIGALVLYLVSTGVSYAAFTASGMSSGSVNMSPEDEGSKEEKIVEDPGLPKTEVCPLNGKLHTEPDRAAWETRRPLLVMLENSAEARPHSGLSKADIVYEAVAEGGISRFMGVFYCGVGENTELAPVRSARTYFLDWASEYSPNPLYAHVGGANCSRDEGTGQCTSHPKAMALEQIQQYGWGGSTGNDLNQFALSFPICYRNPDRLTTPVATEHQMVCQTDKLFEKAADRGWTNVDEDGISWDEDYVPWTIKEDAPADQRGSVSTIDMFFWPGYEDYDVTWDYNAETNEYLRKTGGKEHKDLEADKQLVAKNIVVQFVVETETGDIHKHLLYGTIGTGDALIFQDGTVIEGTWAKKTRLARTIFSDSDGNEIEFNPGVIWIEAIPAGNEVSY